MFEEEKTITLIKPVSLKAGAAEIHLSELKLREPTAGELEKATRLDTNIGVTIELISQVTGQNRKLVEKICQRDLRAASDFFGQQSSDGAQTEAAGESE